LALLLQDRKKMPMKKNTANNHNQVPVAPRTMLDKKAEKYLREGGKIEDMPEGKLKDEDPQQILKTLKEKGN
jgi:hypothetical protein